MSHLLFIIKVEQGRSHVILLQAIVAGDYIMSVSSIMLARLGNNQVVEAYSQILQDLVAGT